MKRSLLSLTLFFLLITLAACSAGPKKTEPAPSANVNTHSTNTVNNGQPITLRFLFQIGHKPLMPIYKEIIEKKFPNVTVDTILAEPAKKTDITDFIASGNVPDLMSWPFGSIEQLEKLQIMSDLSPYIKKYQFDLNRLVPGVVDAVKSFSPTGQFLFMPYMLNNNALYYNKDIFDKFAAPYPTNDMTWEQVYELAKKLTRKDNNTQYIGFLYPDLNLIYKNQMNLPLVDPKTNKTLINSDGWKKWISIMGAFHKIEGSKYTAYGEGDYFMKDKILAMRSGGNILTNLANIPDLNWDVVNMPHFEGYPAESQINVQYFDMPVTGKQKDAAFQVIAYLMSDEVQTMLSRQGQIPIVQSQSAIDAFGKDVKGAANKNLKAFFDDKIAPPVPWTPYDYLAKRGIEDALKENGTTTKDLNTIMNEEEEKVNQQIEEERTK